jgi:hypothetical protein
LATALEGKRAFDVDHLARAVALIQAVHASFPLIGSADLDEL